MKKILTSLAVASIMLSSIIYAEEIPWLYACEQANLATFIGSERYFEVDNHKNYPLMLADSKTIQIDQKEKTIEVWVVKLASQDGKKGMIKALSKEGNYDDFGYMSILQIIDYKNMRRLDKAASHYTCNGTMINNYIENDSDWNVIRPGTETERILNNIIKKYNLK